MNHLYNSKVDVLRMTRTSDSMGGWTEVEVIVFNDMACRINWLKTSEKTFFDKETAIIDAKLYCAVVAILAGDRIVYNSKTYEVIGPPKNPDNMDRYLIVEMRLIE